VSTCHTDEVIDETLQAFTLAVRALKDEGVA
jgi:hypothetical protein